MFVPARIVRYGEYIPTATIFENCLDESKRLKTKVLLCFEKIQARSMLRLILATLNTCTSTRSYKCTRTLARNPYERGEEYTFWMLFISSSLASGFKCALNFQNRCSRERATWLRLIWTETFKAYYTWQRRWKLNILSIQPNKEKRRAWGAHTRPEQ